MTIQRMLPKEDSPAITLEVDNPALSLSGLLGGQILGSVRFEVTNKSFSTNTINDLAYTLSVSSRS